jgi:CRISPR-associated RAMP protein (TIGR02581 family)
MLRTLQPVATLSNLACDPLTAPCLSNEEVAEIKEQSDTDTQLMQRTCFACRLFGAPWLASKVLIRDLPVREETWFGQFSHRDGVSIARDKGTAQAKRRYTLETVPADTAFAFALIADNVTNAQLGLLLLTLESMNRGLIQLGGARSRGLGDVKLEVDWDNVGQIESSHALEIFGEWAVGKELLTTVWGRQQRDAYITDFFREIELAKEEITRWQTARQPREAAHGE